MHARSTTITADVSAIDRGTQFVKSQLLPALLRVDGCRGLSILVDRETGTCIATSSWEDEQAMRASEEEVRPLRDDFVATFGGGPPAVVEWEVALMHRHHPSPEGAWARVTWLEGGPVAIDNSVGAFRSALATAEKTMPGLSGASMLIHRDDGRAAGTVVYDNADAAVRTRAHADTYRAGVAGQSGTGVVDVREFELAVARLRVPELA
jgi:hypothetical protein